MITLHEMRWAYAAARAAVYATLLVLISMLDASVGAYIFGPSIEHGRRYAVRGDDLVVTVRSDGNVFAGSAWVRRDELSAELAWLREHNPRSRFVLRADRYVAFGEVRHVVRVARDAGWRRITIECQPPTLLLHRRIRAGWALPQRDDSKLVERETDGESFLLNRLWY